MLARGEDRTDVARLDAMTDEELDASIDHDDEGEFDYDTVRLRILGPREWLNLPVELGVIEWFKAQGIGFKGRMGVVLNDYVAAQKARQNIGAPEG